MIKLLKNYNVLKVCICWVLFYLISDFELLVFIALNEPLKLTFKTEKKVKWLNGKIKRKLISSIFVQLKSLSLKKNSGYSKVREELREVHSIASKQNWKIHGCISHDVLVAFGR